MPPIERNLRAKALQLDKKVTGPAWQVVGQFGGDGPDIDKRLDVVVGLIKSGQLKFVASEGIIDVAQPLGVQPVGSATGPVKA